MRQRYRTGPPLSVLLCLTIGGLPACSTPDEKSAQPATDGAPVAEYLRTLGTDPLDSTFLMPSDLIVVADTIYALDEAGPDVRIATRDGALLRVIGSKGGGPGQFLGVRGLAVSKHGTIAVSDLRSSRVSSFSGPGALESDFKVARPIDLEFDEEGHIHVDHAGPVPGRDRVEGAPTIGVYSSAGDLLRGYGSYQPQPEPIGDGLANGSRLAADPDGTMWTLYPYRGEFIHWSGDGARLSTRSLPPPEGLPTDGPFTRKLSGPEDAWAIIRMPVAEDIALESADGRTHRVHVLRTVERTGLESEVLVYSVNGDSLGVYPLIHRARRMAIDGGLLYALALDGRGRPTPQIDVYALGERKSDPARRSPR